VTCFGVPEFRTPPKNSIAGAVSAVECNLFFRHFHQRLTISMTESLKTLRVVQWSMLASILVYAILGEAVARGARAVNPTVSYLFSTMAVAIIGVIFVVRRTLVFRAAESLAVHPDDSLSLSHWRTGYIATYLLCEVLALLGLALHFLGGSLQHGLPFYVGGFILLFFFRPRQPASASST